jgi:hypothetical protein
MLEETTMNALTRQTCFLLAAAILLIAMPAFVGCGSSGGGRTALDSTGGDDSVADDPSEREAGWDDSDSDAGRILVQSTFDVDHEGWVISGNGERTMPEWEPADDPPGGCIAKNFNVSATIAYWDAPAAFLGDVSEAYGGTLTFETFIKAKSNKDAKLVILTGPDGLVLDLNMPFEPDTGWTAFSVRLDESGGWKNAETEFAATQEEVRAVLSDLVQLRIRGEYPAHSVRPLGKLDNVVIRLP